MKRYLTFLSRLLPIILLVFCSTAVCAQPLFESKKPNVPAHNSFVWRTADQGSPLAIGTGSTSQNETDTSDAEPTETFGTKILNWAMITAEQLRTQAQISINNFSALPESIRWFNRQNADTKHQYFWNTIGNDLLIIIGIPLSAAIALEFLLLPARNNLRRRRPDNFASRLGTLLGLFGLKLLPVLLFLGASLTFLGEGEPDKVPRFVLLNVIYALTLGRVVLASIRALLAPKAPALRLISATTTQAVYTHNQLRTFSLVIIYGYFCIDIARTIHIPVSVINVFGNFLGLALVLMTIKVIIQKRTFIANQLRGSLIIAHHDLSLFGSLRLWFSRHWHSLAIGYLVIGYAITALGVDDGFVLMLRGTIITLLIFILMRLLFHAADRWGAGDTTAVAAAHHAILRFLLRIVIWVLAGLGMAASWGVDIPLFFSTSLGQRLLGASFSIGVTIVAVTLVYEILSVGIERRLSRRDAEGKVIQASARVRTILPMIRNMVFVVFSIIVVLVALSEAGINIGPLLAGAGVVGVAIGFGSQTLVKDFLTGFFIVVENVIAVGERIKIGEYSGVVESISVRTVRLRDWDGALHILPFSEVSKITNLTKDFSYAQVNVSVACNSDLEHVMKVIRSVGDQLQNDPNFKRAILEPIEVQGVDNLGDYSITIASRIRTRPGKQWDVKRMFLLRLVQRFDKEGIEIPFPTANRIQVTH
jgi:moderate conductance mechanosensitive channel